MKIDQDNEHPMSGWIVLAGCIVSLLGVLAMSRFCDIREKDMVSKLKEAEARAIEEAPHIALPSLDLAAAPEEDADPKR